MKKWYYKSLCALLGVTMVLGAFSSCGEETVENIPVSLPNYADDCALDLLGYVNPTNGKYTYDGVELDVGEDFRTVERFKEYKEAGFNIAFARYDSALPADVTAEGWATSDTKLLCDMAYEAGLSKILLTDYYFDDLVTYSAGDLVGTSGSARYATQEEMDADIAARLSIYKNTPGFYGVIMKDEPHYEWFSNYALVYKSIKRAMPEIYVYHNLPFDYKFHIDENVWKEQHNGEAPTRGEAYIKYLSDFLEMTGAENLSIDVYPFKDRPEERLNFFWHVQVLQQLCAQYGAEVSFTLQSICYTSGETLANRILTKNDLWLQMNTLLGFGATSLQYYTYFPHPENTSTQSNIGNFMDKYGNKTSVYYDAKKVNEDVLKFDHILLNYKFQGAKMYLANMMTAGTSKDYIGKDDHSFINNWEHTLLKDLSFNNDALLTTELKDSQNNLYMYMIMNPIDVLYSENGVMSYTECTFTANFPGYDYVAEFDCGELTYVKLDNGKYTHSLSSGYAVYLIPLKVA